MKPVCGQIRPLYVLYYFCVVLSISRAPYPFFSPVLNKMHTIWRPPKGNILAESELLNKKRKACIRLFHHAKRNFFAKNFQKRTPHGGERRALLFRYENERLCKNKPPRKCCAAACFNFADRKAALAALLFSFCERAGDPLRRATHPPPSAREQRNTAAQGADGK